MPQDDDDLPATPKCLFCAGRRDGQRYRLWGAIHVSSVTKSPLFSDVTTVTSKYRDMKRVSYYACRPCARWAVRWAAVPFVGSFVLLALGFLASALLMTKIGPNVRIGLFVGAGLTGLIAVGLAAQSLFPDTDSANHDGSLRDRATRRLKAKGKGDTYFTEREYEVGFLKKSGDGQDPVRHKTAADLLEDSEDDEGPARRRRK